MLRQVIIIANSIYLFCLMLSTAQAAESISFENLVLPTEAKAKLEKGQNYLLSSVKTLNNGANQQFEFILATRHPKSCRFALKKLQNYENFRNYIEMVTTSLYSPDSNELYIELDPPIISENLILNFKIERITKPGVYHFTFDRGFLNGLKGSITALDYKHRCIISVKADWMGPKTKYSDQILSLFAGTAASLAMEKLVRISSSY